MLRRVLPAVLLVVAGLPMLENPQTIMPGVFLVGVGLAVLVLPSVVRRSRAE